MVRSVRIKAFKNYKAAVEYQSSTIESFRKEFLLSNVIASVFDDKNDRILNNKFSEHYINYLISAQLLLKEKYSTMVYAGNIQKDLVRIDSQVTLLRKELLDRDSELESLLSITRSARLLADNIKRRIKYGIGR